MEVLTLLPTLATLMLWPLITGIVARTFGRKFWIWFMLGFAFPFISLVVLHCLSHKNNQKILGNCGSIQPFIFKKSNIKLKKAALASDRALIHKSERQNLCAAGSNQQIRTESPDMHNIFALQFDHINYRTQINVNKYHSFKKQKWQI